MRHVAFMVAFATLAPFPAYSQNEPFSDCRTLEVAGNFVGSDEALVNGLVCKVGKPKTNSTASTEAAAKTAEPSAVLLGIMEPKILRSPEKAEASPAGANPAPAVTPRARQRDSVAAGARQASSSEMIPKQSLGEIARGYPKEVAKPEAERAATPANIAPVRATIARQLPARTLEASPVAETPAAATEAKTIAEAPPTTVVSSTPLATQKTRPGEETATSLVSRVGEAQEPQTERPLMAGSIAAPQPVAANPPTQPPASDPEEDAAFREGQAPTCHKNVSLGSMEKDKLFLAIPGWASEWYEKNQKRFPGICFSDSPMPGAQNYLVVFHTAAEEDRAAESLTMASPQTETPPTSGVGGFTTSYGSTWHYAHEQTVATTITSVSAEKAPHNRPSTLLSATAYSEQGIAISGHRPASAPKRDKETSPKSKKGQNVPLPEFRAEADLLNRMVEDIAKR